MEEIKKVEKVTQVEQVPAEEIAEVLNTVKKSKVLDGKIADTQKIKVVGTGAFAGKKLKKSKALYKDGQNYIVEAGTVWEKIPLMLQKKISFKAEDFK